jgi:exodeoxyribonuclease VII large subunit
MSDQSEIRNPQSEIGGSPAVLTVSELTGMVRSLLEIEIGDVWVAGEVSNLRRQSSGHVYFTLKDEHSQLSCVMFRGATSAGGSLLADGQRVQLHGGVTVYEARGQYQLIVKLVQPLGRGALQAKFEALKAKLAAEGLFDPARKKPIPRFPRTIGIVTSPTGAALQDMLQILERRAPWVRVLVNPVRVQGTGTAAEIAAAIAEFNTWSHGRNEALKVDVIVVARGGGSLEDLWEFNEESVARAIAASELPVVSAVGHEVDFTIADFASDLRAPTPSAAAELIVPDTAALRANLQAAGELLRRSLIDWTERARERLQAMARGELLRAPRRRLDEEGQRVDLAADAIARETRARIETLRHLLAQLATTIRPNAVAAAIEAGRQEILLLQQGLVHRVAQRLQEEHARLHRSEGLLRVLGPQATLERGYTITMDESGRALTSTREVRAGMKLRTKLSDGEVASTAD